MQKGRLCDAQSKSMTIPAGVEAMLYPVHYYTCKLWNLVLDYTCRSRGSMRPSPWILLQEGELRDDYLLEYRFCETKPMTIPVGGLPLWWVPVHDYTCRRAGSVRPSPWRPQQRSACPGPPSRPCSPLQRLAIPISNIVYYYNHWKCYFPLSPSWSDVRWWLVGWLVGLS